MKTFHIYKANCFTASRVMLQSSWDNEVVFVHRPDKNLALPPPFTVKQSIQLTLLNIFRLAISNRNSDCCAWVFHAQSSLPYLIIFKIFSCLFINRNANIIYDIHDIHEKQTYTSTWATIRFGIIRHCILAVLEQFVMFYSRITVMTVSEGLAHLIAKCYRSKVPSVVRSACAPKYTATELYNMSRIENAIVYFGTKKHLPFDLIEDIGILGYELHLYGRDITQDYIESCLGTQMPAHLKIFGEYYPSDLTFLANYRFLLMYHPLNHTNNYAFSQPNKMFQGLVYGLTIIVSSNFKEILSVLSCVKGAVQVIEDPRDLKSILKSSKQLQEREFYEAIVTLGHRLHDRSQENYQNCIRVYKNPAVQGL